MFKGSSTLLQLQMPNVDVHASARSFEEKHQLVNHETMMGFNLDHEFAPALVNCCTTSRLYSMGTQDRVDYARLALLLVRQAFSLTFKSHPK